MNHIRILWGRFFPITLGHFTRFQSGCKESSRALKCPMAREIKPMYKNRLVTIHYVPADSFVTGKLIGAHWEGGQYYVRVKQNNGNVFSARGEDIGVIEVHDKPKEGPKSRRKASKAAVLKLVKA